MTDDYEGLIDIRTADDDFGFPRYIIAPGYTFDSLPEESKHALEMAQLISGGAKDD